MNQKFVDQRCWKLLLCLPLILILASCTTTVESDSSATLSRVSAGDLSSLQNDLPYYAWHPNFGGVYMPDDVNKGKLMSKTHTVTEDILRSNGYLRVEPDQDPGFLITLALVSESEVSDDEIVEHVGLVVGLVTDKQKDEEFQKSSLVVAVFEPNQFEPIWRSVAQGVTDMKKLNDIPEERLREVLTWMLEPLPQRTEVVKQ